MKHITPTVDFKTVTEVSKMRGDDAEDTRLLRGLLEEAVGFLAAMSWCKAIEETYFGMGVGGVFGVFLFRIKPAKEGVDEWLWVVVGDLPPAYLVTDLAPNPEKALLTYIREMRRWITAVRKGRSLDDVIPVNAPPTPQYADMLESRVNFLRDEILRVR